MEFLPITKNDIEKLPEIQPNGWNDIRISVDFLLTLDCANTLKLEENGKLIGTGASLVFEKTAWLALIIIHPEKRNKGLGRMVTERLVSTLQNLQLETLLLIATDLGEPVYKKIGFETDTEYLFYKKTSVSTTAEQMFGIVDFTEDSYDKILALDKEFSGENRISFLGGFISKSRLYFEEGELTGFYLPHAGEGLIVAKTQKAGVALLTEHMGNKDVVVFPVENKIAQALLVYHHWEFQRNAKRMFLGKPLQWKPQWLYSRVSGQIG